ncbi:MAG: type II toxin-antitoxin system RelE/ParE family toxin [Chloroflexi bacterium]|nr:type II toxin-antitoxin system RelE/ParE family toxin [Chloroflexota bacterium]
MTRAVRLLGAAADDLAGAVQWYESHRAGLGTELLNEFDRALTRVTQSPRLGASVRMSPRARLRRFRLARSPYSIIYRAQPNEIVVVAVAHASREPNFWKGRK